MHHWVILYPYTTEYPAFSAFAGGKCWRCFFQRSGHLKLKTFSLGYDTKQTLKKRNLWGICGAENGGRQKC